MVKTEGLLPDLHAVPPDEIAAEKDLLEHLQTAVQNWPRAERDTFELYFIEGFDPDEIAMVTRQTLKTVQENILLDSKSTARGSARAGSHMKTNPNSTAPDDNITKAPSELEALKAELESQRDRSLRLAADFDNFRRRTAQDADRRAAAQKEAFIRELLPIIDNLERAIASDESTTAQQLREGVEMTLQPLRQLLRQHGIESEDSLGQPFDPHRHEALSTRNDPAHPDHTILEVFQRGYRRGDEVFRPAKVIVNDLSRVEASGIEEDPNSGQ